MGAVQATQHAALGTHLRLTTSSRADPGSSHCQETFTTTDVQQPAMRAIRSAHM